MEVEECYVIFILKYIPVRLRGTTCHSVYLQVLSTVSTTQVPDQTGYTIQARSCYIGYAMIGQETDRPGGAAGPAKRMFILIL
eukprot:SAG31_NODE_3896_length_3772_cov_12.045467_4_plen_83_part_00